MSTINCPCWLSGNCPELPRVQGHGLACYHLVHHRFPCWIIIYLIYIILYSVCASYPISFSIRFLGIKPYDLVSYLYCERNPDRIIPPCYKYIGTNTWNILELRAAELHLQRTEITSCWPESNARQEMTACMVVRLHHAGRGEQLNDGVPTKMRGSEPWKWENRNKPPLLKVIIPTLHTVLI